MVALHGWGEETGLAREVEANAHGPHSATPYLFTDGRSAGAATYVCLVVLARDAVHPQVLRESIRCEVDDDGSVQVTFPDGESVVA